MTQKKNEVTKATPPKPPAMGGGQGVLGNIDPKDLILPRIELGQAMSPSVQEGKNKPGDIYNSITNEVYPSPIHIIPVKNEKNFIKWIPRDQGGGILYRTDDPQDPKVLEDTKWGDDGSKPSCTAYLNFLCIIRGVEMPVVASFHDTGYQTGRRLLTMMAMNGGQVRSYVLGATVKTNAFGKFFVYTVEQGGPVDDDELQRATALHNTFAETKMNFADERSDSSAAPVNEVEEF